MQEDAIFVSDDSHAESGTAKELAELKAMLRRQDAEVERLRVQLAATEIEKRKDTEIPDLNLDGIEEFLKKERVTVWMKDACAVLKKYVTAVPKPSRPADVGGKQGEQLSLGDALAYRMWKVLIVAHATYVKRYSPGQASGPKGKSENFDEAMASGGDSWRYITAKICSHRRVRVEISTRTRWFFLCWKFVIFHAKFMCGVSPYPTQPLFALSLHHWVPLQTLPTVGRLLPLQSVPKTILNFPKQEYSIQETGRGSLLVIQGRRLDTGGCTTQRRLP